MHQFSNNPGRVKVKLTYENNRNMRNYSTKLKKTITYTIDSIIDTLVKRSDISDIIERELTVDNMIQIDIDMEREKNVNGIKSITIHQHKFCDIEKAYKSRKLVDFVDMKYVINVVLSYFFDHIDENSWIFKAKTHREKVECISVSSFAFNQIMYKAIKLRMDSVVFISNLIDKYIDSFVAYEPNDKVEYKVTDNIYMTLAAYEKFVSVCEKKNIENPGEYLNNFLLCAIESRLHIIE